MYTETRKTIWKSTKPFTVSWHTQLSKHHISSAHQCSKSNQNCTDLLKWQVTLHVNKHIHTYIQTCINTHIHIPVAMRTFNSLVHKTFSSEEKRRKIRSTEIGQNFLLRCSFLRPITSALTIRDCTAVEAKPSRLKERISTNPRNRKTKIRNEKQERLKKVRCRE